MNQVHYFPYIPSLLKKIEEALSVVGRRSTLAVVHSGRALRDVLQCDPWVPLDMSQSRQMCMMPTELPKSDQPSRLLQCLLLEPFPNQPGNDVL